MVQSHTEQASTPSSQDGASPAAFVGMEYGHWGITVWQRHNERDYAPFHCQHFGYPVVNGRGPMDSASVEAEALAYCESLGGKPKGPFFKHR